MTPSRIEYDLGSNVHGQPVRLVRAETTGRGPAWTIYRDAADQRDDSSEVGGLTSEQIKRMGDAVKQHS
ncbi:hypothetical protein K0B96_06475 [Horticoccus luteus]|uniref:Uncharacterized protein n=1 Tax=Horticoccus luteus TaxID=2862869 RepID=A0A8F9TYM1_9BACT|nr:hypothetical protein [Horticoccus luteus]QYM80254.1 hypothetical protein K0B96_06475 [Horticoccus luteus]